MRLFADENIPASSVRVLRTMGNEVFYACDSEEVAEVFMGLINDGVTLDGMFTVCDRESIRQRPLLSSAS